MDYGIEIGLEKQEVEENYERSKIHQCTDVPTLLIVDKESEVQRNNKNTSGTKILQPSAPYREG